jgi:hypothetical protein
MIPINGVLRDTSLRRGTRRCRRTFHGVSAKPLACPDPAGTANRLIPLLPHPRHPVPPSLNLFVETVAEKHPAFVSNLLIVLAYMILFCSAPG